MYWYRDNWTSKRREFKTLRQAEKAASKEYGVSVCIYGPKHEIVKIATASGFMPA